MWLIMMSAHGNCNWRTTSWSQRYNSYRSNLKLWNFNVPHNRWSQRRWFLSTGKSWGPLINGLGDWKKMLCAYYCQTFSVASTAKGALTLTSRTPVKCQPGHTTWRECDHQVVQHASCNLQNRHHIQSGKTLAAPNLRVWERWQRTMARDDRMGSYIKCFQRCSFGEFYDHQF